MNDEELNSWISKNNAGLLNGNTEGMNGYVQCFNSGIHFGFEQGAKMLFAHLTNLLPTDRQIERIAEICAKHKTAFMNKDEDIIKIIKECWEDGK